VHFTDKVMYILYVSVNKCYKLHLTRTKMKTDSKHPITEMPWYHG